jgi:hypothetical protein
LRFEVEVVLILELRFGVWILDLRCGVWGLGWRLMSRWS